MEYRLIRSNRKTVALEVTKDCEIIVRAPQKMPLRDIESFAARHRAWAEQHLEKRLKSYRPDPTPQDIQRLIDHANGKIPPRVEHFSKIMGLYPTGIKITRAKTRFGSCSGKNSLCFSCLLMQYPQSAVDYVVVHELAHIKYKHHQKPFWVLVESVMPDYRERQALLKLPPDIPYTT